MLDVERRVVRTEGVISVRAGILVSTRPPPMA
jgi:hypothetical protein